jgi:cytoplasmic FMR1 interacting protein
MSNLQFSWKLLHPTSYSENRSCPEDAEEYERVNISLFYFRSEVFSRFQAIRYNFSSEEKCAITELLAMIKGVQKLVQQLQEEMLAASCSYIYSQLQELVQIQVREPLRKATKNKKEVIRRYAFSCQCFILAVFLSLICSTLVAMRTIASHLADNFNPNADPLLTKFKKDSQTGFKVPLNSKAVPPSSSQVKLLSQIEALQLND